MARATAPLSFIPPMTATLVETIPRGAEWMYEVKLDGYRALAVKERSRVRLLSRKGNDLARDYPAVARAVASIDADTAMLDGEIVAVDAQGRPSFQALQHRSKTTGPIVYYAFDLLHRDGTDLRSLGLEDRRHQLAEVIEGSAVLLSEELAGDPADVAEAVRALGLEGIIAKRRKSRYQSVRSSDWLKIKFLMRQEFVVAGYKPSAANFEALTVGYYDDAGKLWFAGKVRNGYTPALRAAIWREIEPLKSDRFPFADKPARARSHWGEGLTTEDLTTLRWLRPKLVAEIGFVEWTRDGRLRHSTFIGLRRDKDPRDVRREVAPAGG